MDGSLQSASAAKSLLGRDPAFGEPTLQRLRGARYVAQGAADVADRGAADRKPDGARLILADCDVEYVEPRSRDDPLRRLRLCALCRFVPQGTDVVFELEESQRGDQLDAMVHESVRVLRKAGEFIGGKRWLLQRLEDFASRPLEPGQIAQVGSIDERREPASELSQVRVLRGMRVDVPGSDLEERFVAEGGNDLWKHFPQCVDLAMEEHARVDRDALFRGQRRRADERVQRTVGALEQIPEEALALGEIHARASASTWRARWLCSTSRSSSGTWSSHSMSAGTRPKRRTADRYSSQTASTTGASCVSRTYVPWSLWPARWNCPTRSIGIPAR